MCDKYTISEKIELVTLISALKDYNEVINSLRNPNTSRKPNRSYICKLVKTWGKTESVCDLPRSGNNFEFVRLIKLN